MPAKQIYEFGPFRLDPAERLLLRSGEPVALTPKAFDTLVALVADSGHLIRKDDLMKRVWPDAFVEEVNLSQNVNAIRRALSTNGEQYIETVPKAGYRFMVPIRRAGAEAAVAVTADGAAAVRQAASKPRKARWIMGTALVVAAVAAIFAVLKVIAPELAADKTSAAGIHSIAVLPLANLSADPAQEYFSDGLTDELITFLAQIGSLRVISRTSVMGYKHSLKKVPEIGNELHVDGIVEGTVERAQDRVRIRVQLIRTSTDQHLWAESYDRESKDVLQLESDVAHEIAQQIGYVATEQPRREPAISTQAHENYLMGRYRWNQRTEAGLQASIKDFETAIGFDPGYARAYVGLADSYVLLGYYSVLPPKDAYPRAKAAARKAIELDPMLGEAHTSLAGALQDFDWDWKEVEREHKRALELSPNYATAHQWYGNFLNMMGRFDEAQTQIRQARDLDPLSLIISCNLGWAYHLAGNYDLAIQELQRTRDLDPNFYWSHLALGRVYVEKKMYAEAVSAFERAAELAGGNPMVLSELGHAYGVAGRRPDANRTLAKLAKLSQQRYVSGYDRALIYVGLGQRETAIDWLEQAYREHNRSLQFSRVEPRLDPLRSEPRFKELLRHMNFPD